MSWIDAHGLVSPRRLQEPYGLATGNGLAYTATYLAVSHLSKKKQPLTDLNAFISLVQSCTHPTGELDRGPLGTHPDQQAWDDYLAILCAYQILGFSWNAFAFAAVCHERRKVFGPLKLRYFMNNEQFIRKGATSLKHADGRLNVEAYIGRILPLRCLMAWSLSQKPGLFLSWVWAYSIKKAARLPILLPNGRHTHQGEYRTSWLMCEAYEAMARRRQISRIPRCDEAVKEFRRSLAIRNLTMADTQLDYWDSDHPILRLWRSC